MTDTLKILQLNICRSRIASLQLKDYCASNTIDIVLLQEPLIQQHKVYAFENNRQVHKGDHTGAAVIILNNELRIIELAQYTSDYVVTIRGSKQDDTRAITVVWVTPPYVDREPPWPSISAQR
ncbi:unnamed protein product [Macrosiphum euphorbiae]|nr:unnamed protein product [Macrosiphum euphorbiae]